MGFELYKKYRPTAFDQFVGSGETVNSLRTMLERGSLPHAVLFHGPSGCGKTTLARIVKDELECSAHDYTEMNSSSFRGVDGIRDIQKVMSLSPVCGPVRVWLLDEAHKLTNDAQNAALKMLEDTPDHVYFFICTTEPEKLIKALVNRCSDMAVRLVSEVDMDKLVGRVVKKEKLAIPADVLAKITSTAMGSPRLALVLLDKIANLTPGEMAAAVEQRAAEENEAIDLCRLLIKIGTPWKAVAAVLKNLKGEPENTRRAVLGYARAVLLNSGDHRAYMVIDCFLKNLYDSGAAGLAFQCYECIHAK